MPASDGLIDGYASSALAVKDRVLISAVYENRALYIAIYRVARRVSSGWTVSAQPECDEQGRGSPKL